MGKTQRCLECILLSKWGQFEKAIIWFELHGVLEKAKVKKKNDKWPVVSKGNKEE